MKSNQWGGAVVLAALASACGGSSVQGGPQGVGASPSLNITVTGGGGAVTSPDGAFNCTGTCSRATVMGAAIHLDAAPIAGTQFMGWSGACFGTGGCDLTIAGDTAVGAAFAAQPQGPVTIEVEMDGAGSGLLTSSPAGIRCPGSCSMQVEPGTIVALTSSANATSRFDGYGGATCHGTTCNFVASAAAKIFASFSSTVITATHTLTVTAAGDGAIVSSPSGISCPGTCSASFQESATVLLTATAASGSTFTGWSGACAGTGGCSISLGGDAATTATFTADDPCTGLMPTLPAPKTFIAAAAGSMNECGQANTDGDGNLYVDQFFDGSRHRISGTATGTFDDILFVSPLQSGFIGAPDSGGPDASIAYAPDGTIASTVTFPGPAFSIGGDNANGGSIHIAINCDTAAQTTSFVFIRIDDHNQVVSRTTYAEDGCLDSAGFQTMVDLQDNTLLVATDSAGFFDARWFDANGKPLGAGSRPAPPTERSGCCVR